MEDCWCFSPTLSAGFTVTSEVPFCSFVLCWFCTVGMMTFSCTDQSMIKSNFYGSIGLTHWTDQVNFRLLSCYKLVHLFDFLILFPPLKKYVCDVSCLFHCHMSSCIVMEYPLLCVCVCSASLNGFKLSFIQAEEEQVVTKNMFRAHIFSLFIQTSFGPHLSSFPVTQCVSPLPVWWLWWTRRKRRTWGNSTAPKNTAPRTCVPRKQGRCVVSWLLTKEAWRRWNNSAKRDCTLCDATPSRHRPAVWNKVNKWRIWLLSVCVCWWW